MGKPTYDEAIHAFGTVLYGAAFGSAATTAAATTDKSLSSIQHLVDLLWKDYKPVTHTYPFLDYLRGLTRDAAFDTTEGTLVVTSAKATSALDAFHAKAAGQGTYGKVFLSKTGHKAYKRIELRGSSKSVDRQVRAVFLEAWIQTVLGLDTDVAGRIATIERMYSESSHESTVIILKMGALDRDWGSYSAAGTTAMSATNVRKHEFSYIRGRLQDLSELLLYLFETYGFVHRDLHAGNVMFGARRLTLIDFGMSCFQFKHSSGTLVSFGDPERFNTVKACWSFDIFMFLASLIEWESETFSPACIRTIKGFFDIEISVQSIKQTINVFDEVCARTRRAVCDKPFEGPSLFEQITWAMYADSIQNEWPTITLENGLVLNLCNLLPSLRIKDGKTKFVGDTRTHLRHVLGQLTRYDKERKGVPPVRVSINIGGGGGTRRARKRRRGGYTRRGGTSCPLGRI